MYYLNITRDIDGISWSVDTWNYADGSFDFEAYAAIPYGVGRIATPEEVECNDRVSSMSDMDAIIRSAGQAALVKMGVVN
jgi:hypothetical protein